MDGPSQLPSPHPPTNLAKSSSDLQLQYLLLVLQNQLDCSPSLPTEPQLRLEAAKSTTGKLIVVVVVVVVHPHTIKLTSSRDVARRRTT